MILIFSLNAYSIFYFRPTGDEDIQLTHSLLPLSLYIFSFVCVGHFSKISAEFMGVGFQTLASGRRHNPETKDLPLPTQIWNVEQVSFEMFNST